MRVARKIIEDLAKLEIKLAKETLTDMGMMSFDILLNERIKLVCELSLRFKEEILGNFKRVE